MPRIIKTKHDRQEVTGEPANTKSVDSAVKPQSTSRVTMKKIMPPKRERKKHRFRPGTQALRQIKHCQKGTEPLIPRASINRLIREIAQDYKTDIRFGKESIDAIRAAAEAHLINMFKAINLTAITRKQQTIHPKDIRLVEAILNIYGRGA